MNAPTREERERAAGVYLRLQSDERHYIQDVTGIPVMPLFAEACKCVQVALRVADGVADAFGLARFDRALANGRSGETAVQWIDRVSLALECWRRDFPREHAEERRRARHWREPRKPLYRDVPRPLK